MSKDKPDKPRLNPFAFPPETNVRFVLLVIAAAMLAVNVSLVMPYLIDPDTGTPYEGMTFNNPERPPDEQFLQKAQERSFVFLRETVSVLALPVGMVIGTVALAAGIYWTYPARLRRRYKLQRLRLPQEKHPELESEIRHLANLTQVSPMPTIELGQNVRSQSGQAFGSKGNPALRLERGLYLVVLSKAREIFRAVVLHELGHIVNQDVWRSYFAQALWAAVIVLAIVPLIFAIGSAFFHSYVIVTLREGTAINVDRLLTTSLPTILITFAHVGVMLLLVVAIRADLLRNREIYADYRAALWGAEASLSRILRYEASKEVVNGWRKIWHLHPTAKERLTALEDPSKLFSVKLSLPFVVGILMALIVGGTVLFILPVGIGAGSVFLAWGASVAEASVRNSSLLLAQLARLIIFAGMAAILLTLLIPVFGLAYLVTRTVGLQILRESVADAAYNRRGIVRYLRLWLPAALLLAGMELGFLITPIPVLSPAGQMIAASNWVVNPVWVLPWMAGGAGLIWLLFVYTRYLGRRILGTNATLTPPKWAGRVYSLVLTSLLGFQFIPILLSRLVVVYPSEPSFQPLHSLVVWFSLSLLSLLVYVAAFALTWIVIMIRRVNLVQQCPLCGQFSQHKEALGQSCEHCNQTLSPWLITPLA